MNNPLAIGEDMLCIHGSIISVNLPLDFLLEGVVKFRVLNIEILLDADLRGEVG